MAGLHRRLQILRDLLDPDQRLLDGLHEWLGLGKHICDVEGLFRLDVASIRDHGPAPMAHGDLDLRLAYETAGLTDLGHRVLPDLVPVLLENLHGHLGVVLLGNLDLGNLADLDSQEHYLLAGLQAVAFTEHRGDVVLLFKQVLALGHQHHDAHEDEDRHQHKPSNDLVETGLRQAV